MTNSNIKKAEAVFKQANSFMKIIDGTTFKKCDMQYLNPFYINCLFCCELYLKSLLIFSGKTISELKQKKHKLLDLFNMLESDDQENIKNILTIEIEEDVIEYLDRVNDDFVNMRYIYINGDNVDSTEINNNFAKTIKLMYRLQNYVSIKLYGRDTYEDVINNVSI